GRSGRVPQARLQCSQRRGTRLREGGSSARAAVHRRRCGGNPAAAGAVADRAPAAHRGAPGAEVEGDGMSGDSVKRPIAIIADDEDLGRLLLAESAAECGLDARGFDNGTAALEAALSQEVAIVLLDVDMPGMDGFAVCRSLRAQPHLATVPIVMVTGHEDSE